ncbi:chromosomal replication initiator protein DnaA [Corynebacterium sp. TAE3-ERU12]|uniref:chromosomal replication initiator protein DnaA n=1 Tax=Corynebacterium sp. TAE3-ERU12 TaxID=2849491 RepID=UPI001C46886C|nr:chromosomal replication initiator protein DnaA [Corynebacterium sp. TAE3-ERU12]MBV7294345.1 chromosomal replication initiator protein DnaA [Corynebacterium sp. TAE3-ERU12]
MSTDQQDFAQIWNQVVETLFAASEDPANPTPRLLASERSLLHSVHPVGRLNSFVLLSTSSKQAKALIEEQLNRHISEAMRAVMGEEVQVVLTVADQPANADPNSPNATTLDAPSQRAAAEQWFAPEEESPGQQHYTEPGTHQQAAFRFAEPPAPHQPARTTPVAEQQPQTPPPHLPGVDSSRPAHNYAPQDYAPQDYSQQRTEPEPPRPSVTTMPSVVTSGDSPAPVSEISGSVPRQMSDPVEEPSLNPKYTFDTFVQGPQNKIAAAAAVAVAENPGRSYNPLYIAGPSGLGKTHLLHAIGHYALNLQKDLRLKYVSSEEFTNDFITSLREDAQESFKRRYRNLDVLLVDDIQFLAGKEGTQGEFFHTFNALYQTNRQIVLSSDRPPNQLVTLEDRLRTRFEQGLYADLSLPDLETRIAILQKKVEQLDHMDIPEDVLIYIAQHTNTSIRALEGDLLQISAQASLLRRQPSVELAREVLGTGGGSVEITPDLIISTTAEYYGLSINDLRSPRRSRPISHARQVTMHLIRRMTNLSLVSIGATLGGRDHATVLHGDNKIEREISENDATRREIDELKARIQERARS